MEPGSEQSGCRVCALLSGKGHRSPGLTWQPCSPVCSQIQALSPSLLCSVWFPFPVTFPLQGSGIVEAPGDKEPSHNYGALGLHLGNFLSESWGVVFVLSRHSVSYNSVLIKRELRLGWLVQGSSAFSSCAAEWSGLVAPVG